MHYLRFRNPIYIVKNGPSTYLKTKPRQEKGHGATARSLSLMVNVSTMVEKLGGQLFEEGDELFYFYTVVS